MNPEPRPTPTTGVPDRPRVRARTVVVVLLVVAVALQLYGLYAPRMPGPDTGIPGADKIGHLLAFAVPVLLAIWLGARPVVTALGIHAVVAEAVQGLVTNERMVDPLDTAANVAGVLLGLVLGRVLVATRPLPLGDGFPGSQGSSHGRSTL